MKRAFLISLLLTTIGCASRSSTISLGTALPITGTFTDFRYSEPLKGPEGVEVRIVVAGDGYEATVQFAEGESSSLTVTRVRFDFEDSKIGEVIDLSVPEQSRLIFELPAGSPRPGTFTGAITRTHLRGTFHFATGETLPVELPRAISHWDR